MTFDPMQNTWSMGAFGFLVGLLGLITTIFWMVVAWRAMRAHEDIADVLRGRAQE